MGLLFEIGKVKAMDMKSWKTTLGGIATILTPILIAVKAMLDNDTATIPDWTAVAVAFPIGLALICARDNDVSSETAGIKK